MLDPLLWLKVHQLLSDSTDLITKRFLPRESPEDTRVYSGELLILQIELETGRRLTTSKN